MSQLYVYRRRPIDFTTKKTGYNFLIKASFTFFTASLFFDFDIAFNRTSSQSGFSRKLSLLLQCFGFSVCYARFLFNGILNMICLGLFLLLIVH